MGRGRNEGADGFWERFSTFSVKDGAVAAAVGISDSTLSSLKIGVRYPPVDIAIKIAKNLNTTVEFLVTGKQATSFKDQKMLSLYKKYEKVIVNLEMLDQERRKSVEEMIDAYATAAGAAQHRDSG